MTDTHDDPWLEDGGPAFPSTIDDRDNPDEQATLSYRGMALRDWFAGQALIGVLAGTDLSRSATIMTNLESYASEAFALADAMIERRKLKATDVQP